MSVSEQDLSPLRASLCPLRSPSTRSDVPPSLVGSGITTSIRSTKSRTLDPTSHPRSASLGDNGRRPARTIHATDTLSSRLDRTSTYFTNSLLTGDPGSPMSEATRLTVPLADSRYALPPIPATTPPWAPSEVDVGSSQCGSQLVLPTAILDQQDSCHPLWPTQSLVGVNCGPPPPPRRSSADSGVPHHRVSLLLSSIALSQANSSVVLRAASDVAASSSSPLCSDTQLPPFPSSACVTPLPEFPVSLDQLARADLERLCQILHSDGRQARQAAQDAEDRAREAHVKLGKLSTHTIRVLKDAQRRADKDMWALQAKDREIEDLRARLGQVIHVLSAVIPGLVPETAATGGNEPEVECIASDVDG